MNIRQIELGSKIVFALLIGILIAISICESSAEQKSGNNIKCKTK
jgi:hypothetical protein